MSEENPFVNTIYEARNLFKTEFYPIQDPIKSKQTLLKLKVNYQYHKTVEKIKFDHEQKMVPPTVQPPNEPNKPLHQPKIKDNTKPDHLQSMIQELVYPEKQVKDIKSFEKFEKNQAEPEIITNQENQIAIKNKLQMKLAESTKLGTIKSSSLKKLIKPKWHAPFKLYRVIVGHQGWVRCIAVSPCNTIFATGSADKTIKFWDMASGELKISLTGHINTIRGMEFSKYHPYLFSCSQDKSVKCWDLQMNQVIRNYHGHLSGVYCLRLHNDLSIVVTGGRDSCARVWDIRVRKQIYSLAGHSHTVGSVITQEGQPHVVTGSYDSLVKLWDIRTGRCAKTLTNHKKSIRTMVQNPFEYTFATAASDNIKVWKCPEAEFLRNISGHHSIIDSMAINEEGVLVSGGDDGSLKFWDWFSGYNFQDVMSEPQPGSIAAQNGIFALNFDRSGTRLLSGECDKTIKMWKEDETATEESHPIKSFKMEFQKK